MRLASQLTGWDIDILTEEEESERRQKEFNASTEALMEALNVDEMVGQLLASEGFSNVEEVAYVDTDEVATIEGFDEETAEEIQARAREFLEKQEAALAAERTELGVEDALLAIDGMTNAILVDLGKDGTKSMEDFAGYVPDDLVGWTERQDGEVQRFEGILKDHSISRAEAEAMIMQARLAAGWVTQEELDTMNAEPEEEEAVEETPAFTGNVLVQE